MCNEKEVIGSILQIRSIVVFFICFELRVCRKKTPCIFKVGGKVCLYTILPIPHLCYEKEVICYILQTRAIVVF